MNVHLLSTRITIILFASVIKRSEQAVELRKTDRVEQQWKLWNYFHLIMVPENLPPLKKELSDTQCWVVYQWRLIFTMGYFSIDLFIVRSLNMILAPFNAMKDALTASLFCKVSQELWPLSLCINSFLSSFLTHCKF